MRRPIALGADHGGLSLKNALCDWLSQSYEVFDLGACAMDPADDYPDFAEAVARAVSSGRTQRGILVCGSGVGACIAANKVPGVRACLCHDTYSAHQGVEHDDMNVLCLGARVVGSALSRELVAAFLNASFSGEDRHRRRVEKVMAIEQKAVAGEAHRIRRGSE
jgi:ribose 5-phosphate isomerase B